MRDNGKMPEVRDFPEWKAERENWFHMAAPVEETGCCLMARICGLLRSRPQTVVCC
jgi:hypothetical protein